MARLVNAYTVSPDDIEPGDIMMFVVKAVLSDRDHNDTLRYRIYRCSWDGDIENIPQGSHVPNMEDAARNFFPVLQRDLQARMITGGKMSTGTTAKYLGGNLSSFRDTAYIGVEIRTPEELESLLEALQENDVVVLQNRRAKITFYLRFRE